MPVAGFSLRFKESATLWAQVKAQCYRARKWLCAKMIFTVKILLIKLMGCGFLVKISFATTVLKSK